MLEFDEAQSQLTAAAPVPARTETVSLAQAAGRVLAAGLTATVDLPSADNSAMDGYAIHHSDYQPGARLPIQQRCYAGEQPAPLIAGQATRLFTGSLMPQGADTVIMQEDTREADGTVEITAAPSTGQHVRKLGEDVRAGTPLLSAGALLQAAHIALLASQGLAQVEVYPRLRVGILTTGDELAVPGQPRQPGQVYNSNGPMLAALAQGLGADVVRVLHARDDMADLQAALRTLQSSCDLVVSVGGVSVGDHDLVKPAIESLGGELALWKVRMKPGKPVAMARLDSKLIVCLPGNPVSAYAVFTVLVSPMIRRMQGRAQVYPPVLRAALRTEKTRQDSREEFLRVQYHPLANGSADLTPYGHQGSGVISSLPWADGLARLPAGVPVNDGDIVAYYDLKRWQT
ncbi:MAG TPA: gephyrin-like molybdotransferase Glp [Bordetella sp.]